MEEKKVKLSRRDFIMGSGAVLLTALLGGCKPEIITSTVTSTKTSTLLNTITNALTTTETVTSTGTVTDTVTATATTTVTETITQAAARVITDMSGNQVTIPYDINRIAVTCYGGATHEVAAMGGASKIIAQPTMQKFPTLLKMYPDFVNVPDIGSFDTVNIEELLEVNPDVVIASMAYQKKNQEITAVGIPVIEVYTGLSNLEGIKSEFLMTGELLNNSQRAEALISFWDQQMQVVEEHLQNIPAEAKKKVYYSNGTLTHTDGSAWWGHILITSAGGINVAEALGEKQDIDTEQIAEWNPDVIILRQSSAGTATIPVSEVAANTQLQGINALNNNEIYLCPVGTFWWDRPAPEAILGITWLAKTLYPEHFADVDLENLAKNFYRQFYDYELTSEEYQDFISQEP
jgi:iron complex transport system substrate-binding protein